MRKLRKAEVEWEDTAVKGEWSSADFYVEHAQPWLCYSIGYVLVNDDERVLLVQTCADLPTHRQVSDSVVIPRAAIRKFRYLKAGL